MGSSTKRSVNASFMKGPDRAYRRCLAQIVDCCTAKLINHFTRIVKLKDRYINTVEDT